MGKKVKYRRVKSPPTQVDNVHRDSTKSESEKLEDYLKLVRNHTSVRKHIIAKYFNAAKYQGLLQTVSELKKENNFIDLTGLLTDEELKICKYEDVFIPPKFDDVSEFRRSHKYASVPLYEHQFIRVGNTYLFATFRMIDSIGEDYEFIKNLIEKSDGNRVFEYDYTLFIRRYGFHTFVETNDRVWNLSEEFLTHVYVYKDLDTGEYHTRFNVINNDEVPIVDGFWKIDECIDHSLITFTDEERAIFEAMKDEWFPKTKATDIKESIESCVANLIGYFVIINKMLYEKRTKTLRNSGKKAKVTYDKSVKGEPPRKLTRVVDGKIKIVSEKKPKAFDGVKHVNYQVAKWNRRGYERTLKSGKTIYIQPTTCHRKALEDIENNQEVRKSDMIFTKKPEIP